MAVRKNKMLTRNKGSVFSVDLARNHMLLCDGEIIPITQVIGRAAVAGPTLSAQWITSTMTDDEYARIDAWRAKYGEREN